MRTSRRYICEPNMDVWLQSSLVGFMSNVCSLHCLLIVFSFCFYALLCAQLFPHKHGGPYHQGIWRQGDTDLWPRRRTRTHAEAAGLGQQVLQTRNEHTTTYVWILKVPYYSHILFISPLQKQKHTKSVIWERYFPFCDIINRWYLKL